MALMENILGTQVAQGHTSSPPLQSGSNPNCISSNLVMQQTQVAMLCKPLNDHVFATPLAILQCCQWLFHQRAQPLSEFPQWRQFVAFVRCIYVLHLKKILMGEVAVQCLSLL